jgi:transketolase
VKTIEELKLISTQVRRDILRMTNGSKSGHPGGSLGCADFLTSLFFNQMRIEPTAFTMDGKQEDLFFLSNGHISPVLYSVLARRGYFPVKELATFRKLGSRLQGHPCVNENLPGIRIASGSLGQGLSVALGAALAKKLNGDKHMVYCLTGDGELQEGQNWEALMFGAQKQVDNIIMIVDYNLKQIDGPTDSVISLGNLQAKLSSFNWETIEMNGNDVNDIALKLPQAIQLTGKSKPVAIIMHTKMGFGVDFMLDNHKWHGSAPNDEQLANALSQLPETIGDY